MKLTPPPNVFSTSLKRPRSNSQISCLPPLPKIDSDLILQVYTHTSLRRPGYNCEEHVDNERLIELGRNVLQAAVTHVLFHQRPMLKASELCIQRAKVLSDENIEEWVNMYGMRQKLRCHPDLFSALNTPKEAHALFSSYVGGVYTEHGIDMVQDWIGRLLGQDTELPPEPSESPPPRPVEPPSPKRIKSEEWSPAERPTTIFFASQPPPSPPRHPPPHFPLPSTLPNPLAPAQPGLPFLPLFNQTAAQRRVTVEYPAEFSGPSHAGRWTVRCVVNGIPKGVGIGNSKQVAKEEAARQAYYAMGWT